jgi:hypothetical protein
VLPSSMIEMFDRLEEVEAENNGDVRVAIALLKEAIVSKMVRVEEYSISGSGVNSYIPFMNFLQDRNYRKVRRYLLIHPGTISAGRWKAVANGVFL